MDEVDARRGRSKSGQHPVPPRMFPGAAAAQLLHQQEHRRAAQHGIGGEKAEEQVGADPAGAQDAGCGCGCRRGGCCQSVDPPPDRLCHAEPGQIAAGQIQGHKPQRPGQLRVVHQLIDHGKPAGIDQRIDHRSKEEADGQGVDIFLPPGMPVEDAKQGRQQIQRHRRIEVPQVTGLTQQRFHQGLDARIDHPARQQLVAGIEAGGQQQRPKGPGAFL